jgi:hypothetical protein
MLVTSLRDGMNLVAKEYVASRIDERGALVLSEFTGAAIELKQSYVVNPHDIDGLKAAIVVAASVGPREASRRMRALRRRVFEFDVSRWAQDSLRALERSRTAAGIDEAGQPDLLAISPLEPRQLASAQRPVSVDLGPDDPDLASLEEDDLSMIEPSLAPLAAGLGAGTGRLDDDLATLLRNRAFDDLDQADLERLHRTETADDEFDRINLERAELARSESDRIELDRVALQRVALQRAELQRAGAGRPGGAGRGPAENGMNPGRHS